MKVEEMKFNSPFWSGRSITPQKKDPIPRIISILPINFIQGKIFQI
jgi:hypothetical protein